MTLSELIERVEKLDGPSRNVDCEIAWLTNWNITGKHGGKWRGAFPQWRGDEYRTNRAADNWGVPMFTASLDAAIALTERVLPDANRTIRKRFRTTEGRIDGHKFDAQVTGGDVCEGFNEATALVLATLRSLSAQERDDGR